jgi:hypothetical protein
MKKSGLIVAVYLLLTFASGVAVGGLGFWLYSTRGVSANSLRAEPEEWRRRALTEYEARLKLSPDQLQKLDAILDNTRELFQQLNEKHRPEYQAVQQHQNEQIRAILSPDQRAEYEKLREERDRERKKRGRFKH